MNVVTATGLRFSYGRFEAVRGVDLEVRQGEVFALLGANGSGKTTTLELLSGQRRPSSGEIRVLGVDPYRNRPLKRRLGVVPQEGGCAPDLTVGETVRLWRRLHRHPMRTTLIGEVGLEERTHVRVRQLSGGERRRLDLAVALCGEPDLLILDEPTAGLDEEFRERAWQLLRERVRAGATVVLTTHQDDRARADRTATLR